MVAGLCLIRHGWPCDELASPSAGFVSAAARPSQLDRCWHHHIGCSGVSASLAFVRSTRERRSGAPLGLRSPQPSRRPSRPISKACDVSRGDLGVVASGSSMPAIWLHGRAFVHWGGRRRRMCPWLAHRYARLCCDVAEARRIEVPRIPETSRTFKLTPGLASLCRLAQECGNRSRPRRSRSDAHTSRTLPTTRGHRMPEPLSTTTLWGGHCMY